MKKLKVLEENVTAAYEAGDDSHKLLLEKLFPEVFVDFKADPYLVACKKLGIQPRPELADRSDLDWVSADAGYRLTICIRAKNMIDGKIWKPVYDGSENHYFPRWKPNNAGFGLSVTYYDFWISNSTVRERLEYRTYDLMMEGVKEFDKYYQDYLKV